MKTKSNKQFMLLSAFGIFFVVDMHAGSPFGIFNSIFHYESFFMQMFVFISGYFFNEKHLKTPLKYIWKNTVKLMIPFFLINLVYIGLIMLSKLYNPQIVWDYRFSVLNEGRDTVFTLPAWFVPMLYFVTMTYIFLRLLFRKWNHVIAFSVMAVIGMVSVYFSLSDYNNQYTVLALKIAFFIQFYELGGLYRAKLEKYFKKASKLSLIVCCIVANMIMIAITDNKIACHYLYKMTGFMTDIYMMPLLTAVTGICFWLCITEWLAPSLGESRVINYISNHTFAIMFHHIGFFTVLVYILSKIPFAREFDYQQFYTNAGWYKYDAFEGIRFIYVLFALFGCLGLCLLWDKLKMLFLKRKANICSE